jgi:hypothetical protein
LTYKVFRKKKIKLILKQLRLLNGIFGGISPPGKQGKFKFVMGNSKLAKRIRGGLPPNTGAGGANSKNLPLEGGSKTYKTRKHKRTLRDHITPRKWSTRRGTRRR